MIKNSPWTRWFSLGMVFWLTLAMGCQGQKTPEALEAGAQALYDEADRLWKTNMEKKALALYDQLAKEYPDTEVAKKLEKELALRNIYFGSAANSWTNIRLYELENLLVEIFKEKGEYPGAFDTGLDAWDTLITYKVFDGKKVDFDFMVVSAGPDKKFNTGDDLRLVHARNPALATPAGNASAEKNNTPTGGDDLYSLQGLDQAASQSGGALVADETREMTLKDLDQTMSDKKKDAGNARQLDSTMELKDLVEGKF